MFLGTGMEDISFIGQGIKEVNNGNVDDNLYFSRAILEAAEQSIRKKGGKNERTIMSWWADECNEVLNGS